MDVLIIFLEKIKEDPRIATAHISVYVSLWKMWADSGMKEPLSVNRQLLMYASKISGFTTYHKTIKELDLFGYIGYVPSYNHNVGSRVYFTQRGIEQCKAIQQHLF